MIVKQMSEQEFFTNQLTMTGPLRRPIPTLLFRPTHATRLESPPAVSTIYHLTSLTPILNLILHIVYKWEFVSFLDPNENTSTLEEVMKTLVNW